MHRHLMILFAALLALTPVLAHAQSCSSQVTALQFGTISGAPTPSPATDGTANIVVDCSGFSAGTSVRVCLGISAGSAPSSINNRVMVNGGSSVAFQIGTSPGGPNWGDSLAGGKEVSVAVSSTGIGSAAVTMYGRVVSGQNVSAGLYTSNLTVTSRQPSGQSPCANGTGTSFPSAGFAATVMIAGACTIAATPLSFGSTVSSLAGTLDSSGGLSVTCTAGLPYAVKLDGGLIGGAVGNRRMGLNGAGPGVIGYQLYLDGARSQVWGNTAGNTATGTGSGAASTLTVYGRVPAQATPGAGAYRDTVTATVEY